MAGFQTSIYRSNNSLLSQTYRFRNYPNALPNISSWENPNQGALPLNDPGQPMMLRATTVPHMRQWHPRGFRG